MKRFEYLRVVVEQGAELKEQTCTIRCSYHHFNASLRQWGEEGWELVSHSDYDGVEVHMFKRELDPVSPTAPSLEI